MTASDDFSGGGETFPKNHSLSSASPKVAACILDLDGTLYHQTQVRLKMFLRLLMRIAVRPLETASIWRALVAYRRAQEVLRMQSPICPSIADEQVRMASGATRLPETFVRECVREWMEEAPLNLLRAAMRAEIVSFLRAARAQGLRLAVWSDYPAAAKLRAMDLASYFDAVVCAQDPAVQLFKPNSRGLEVILEQLGLSREEVVYIGDRPEVDGVAAANAGVRCFIIGKKRPAKGLQVAGTWMAVSSFDEVLDWLNRNRYRQ